MAIKKVVKYIDKNTRVCYTNPRKFIEYQVLARGLGRNSMTYIVLTKEISVFDHQGVLHRNEDFRRPQLVDSQEKALEVAASENYYTDYGRTVRGSYHSVFAKVFKKEVVEEYYDTYGDGFLEELWRMSEKNRKHNPNPMFYWL